jgi:hypothetical protein
MTFTRYETVPGGGGCSGGRGGEFRFPFTVLYCLLFCFTLNSVFSLRRCWVYILCFFLEGLWRGRLGSGSRHDGGALGSLRGGGQGERRRGLGERHMYVSEEGVRWLGEGGLYGGVDVRGIVDG